MQYECTNAEARKGAMRGENVVALVVTWNRSDLLMQTLLGLSAQIPRLKGVLVVDNGSTDDTVEKVFSLFRDTSETSHLAEKLGLDAFSFPSDWGGALWALGKNTGGAGGFSSGLERLLSTGLAWDWVWLMDDDVSPRPGALEQLLCFSGRSACLQAGKVLPDGSMEEWWGHLNERRLREEPWVEQASTGVLRQASFGCFEGMLLRRGMAGRVPLPDPGFFVNGDDVVYGFSLSLLGPVLWVGMPLMDKLLDKRCLKKIWGRHRYCPPPGTVYYAVRNQLLRGLWLRRLCPARFPLRRVWFSFLSYACREGFKSLLLRRQIAVFGAVCRGVVHAVGLRPQIRRPRRWTV